MGTSIKKTGVISALGSGIGENLVSGTIAGKAVITSRSERSRYEWANLSGGNGTVSCVIDQTAIIGDHVYKIVGNTSGNKDVSQYDSVTPFSLLAGEKYTMSAYFRGSGTTLLRMWNTSPGAQLVAQTKALANTGDWERIQFTFNAPTAANGVNNVGFLFGVTGNATVDICGMKAELGDKATPWIPNEADELYVGKPGFVEGSEVASIGDDYIVGDEFYEI